MASDAALKSADSYLPRLWSFASCSGPLRFAQLYILALGDHWWFGIWFFRQLIAVDMEGFK